MLLHHSPYLPTCKTKANETGVCGGGTKPHSRYYALLSVAYNTLSANTLHGAATLVKQASVKGLLRFS